MEPSNTNSKNNKTQLFLKDLEKKEKSFYNRFATKANFFISTNIRLTSFVVVDLLNNILLHGLDTLKVRLQAKSIFNDTSLFQTNQVSKKSVISGVTSASIGTLISSSAFILSNEYFLSIYFKDYKINKRGLNNNYNEQTFTRRNNRDNSEFSWKTAILKSYLLSDIIRTTVFMPFEARKQRIQMKHASEFLYNSNFYINTIKAYPLLLIRDVIVRVLTLGVFLNLMDVVYSPKPVYNINEIQNILKQAEINGFSVDVNMFIDYSHFNNFSSFNNQFSMLVMCCFFTTILTHPLDVLATKYLTQTDKTYGSLFKTISRIYKYEGIKKFFYSGFSPRLTFNVISALNIMTIYNSINGELMKYYHGMA